MMFRREFIKIVIPLVTIGPHVLLNYEQPTLKYGVIADPQYANIDTKGTRFYRKSLGKLENAVRELNKEKLDFVVTLGDIIDQNFASYDDILPLYDQLNATHHLVLGNHDFDVAETDKNRVLERLDLKNGYYSKLLNGWRFIYLDGTEESLYRYAEETEEKKKGQKKLDQLKADKVPQAMHWNGGMSDQQMKWLKQELDASKTANEKVIISNHYPVLPEREGHNLWNAEELVSLLDQFDNVVLYMNGHNHSGNYAIQNGTHYVNFKGMVETETETAFAIVKCYKDRVEIQGFGLEPDRIAN